MVCIVYDVEAIFYEVLFKLEGERLGSTTSILGYY